MSDNDYDDDIARAASQFPDEQILAPPQPPRISVKRRRRTGTEPPKPRAGGLRTVVEITMHTRQAQRLIEGREGAVDTVPIMGLQEFGQRCRNIWMASAQDDPWADAALLAIEDRLDRARETLAEYHAGIRKTLEQDDRVKIGSPHSSAPVTYRFEFAAAHAFQSLDLAVAYDKLAGDTLAAHHIGRISRKRSEATLAKGKAALRAAWDVARRYRRLDVTRTDVQADNEKAREVTTALGPVAEVVLQGKLLPQFGPVRASGTEDETVGAEDGADASV